MVGGGVDGCAHKFVRRRISVDMPDLRADVLSGQLIFDRFDNVVRHEWFAIVLADVALRVEAGLAPEITGELAAVIVLDNDDIACCRERMRLISGGVERNDPFNVR